MTCRSRGKARITGWDSRGNPGWRRSVAVPDSAPVRDVACAGGRGAATPCLLNVVPEGHVSIHAPVRGRLVKRLAAFFLRVVSIHAPVRGRLHPYQPVTIGCVVSIHAPVRGRPRLHLGYQRFGACFNPRPREGATPPARSTSKPKAWFQSTPP